MATPHPTAYMQRILVVEDDHHLAEMIAEVLTLENHQPDIVGNGMDALDALRTAEYEAVICDLMLPRLDGEQLYAETIKALPYLAERFLFITGQATSRAGFTAFIQRTGTLLLEKPFDVEQLRAAVKELLAR